MRGEKDNLALTRFDGIEHHKALKIGISWTYTVTGESHI